MMTAKPTFYLLTALAMLLGGCATIEKRIDSNTALFETFSPEEQALIREGQIKLGFSPKMVEIAKGNPTYITSKQSAEGDQTIWRYVELNPYTRTIPTYSGAQRGGRDWITITDTQEIEVLRVEFTNDTATTIEELQ